MRKAGYIYSLRRGGGVLPVFAATETRALRPRRTCVCAGFINKCTRKLRVNYGVNDFSRKERRA